MSAGNKNELSDAVDTLMNDMTVGTRRRRSKDRQELDKIREKQYNKGHKSNIFSEMKTAVRKLIHKDVEKDLNATEKWERYPGNVKASELVQSADLYEDNTVVMEEERTVVMEEESNVLAALHFREKDILKCVEIISVRTVIGSLENTADIIIDNRRISRRHAELIVDGDKIYIKDLKSTNGTYINDNDEKITPFMEYRLCDADYFRLADTEFRVEVMR